MTYEEAAAKYRRDGILTGVAAWAYLFKAPSSQPSRRTIGGRPRVHKNKAAKQAAYRQRLVTKPKNALVESTT